MDLDLWSSFRYCSNINLIFFYWQYPGFENCISENPKPFVSWRTVRRKITHPITERKIILKGKLTGHSHKWKPSNHEELRAFLGLLTIIMGVINMSRPDSMLKYQRLRSTPAFWTSFYWRQEVTDVPLYHLQKKLHGKYTLSILHLYFGSLKSNRSML